MKDKTDHIQKVNEVFQWDRPGGISYLVKDWDDSCNKKIIKKTWPDWINKIDQYKT